MPKVSIVSVFYNRAALADRTVESLKAQNFDDYEIVLVDDGSTDGTLAALKAHEGGRVRVLSHPNKGFTIALHEALDKLDCRYIAIQGSGDRSYPERLRLQTTALDESSEVVAVAGGVDVVHPQTGALIRERQDPIAVPAAQTMLRGNPFSHGETMYRAKTYRACGGYRTFFKFAQDRDLFCRMSRCGEFFRVPQKIYARLSYAPGSVSATPANRIQQALFSDFAVRCHREVLAGRPDPLEAHGPSAALFAGRSREAARGILRSALRSLARREYARAGEYARFLQSYAPGPSALLVLAISRALARPQAQSPGVGATFRASDAAGSSRRLT